MQMRTHHQASKRGSMEEEDRLSSLPDELLHSILHKLPLKHAVRTSVLSRRWAPQWLRALASSRILDFTDPDLAPGELPPQLPSTVRRCLELHAEHGTPLDVLRVSLRAPSEGSCFGAFQRDVVGWIASAVARGAREVEVEVDMTPPPPTGKKRKPHADSAAFVELPGDLLVPRNSLARLALCGFSLRAVPAAPTGLAGLRSLSLSYADIRDEVLGDVVSSCRALEHLRLSKSKFELIKIASQTLRVLEIIGCLAVKRVRVTAPALESIAIHHYKFIWTWPDWNAVDDDVYLDFHDELPPLWGARRIWTNNTSIVSEHAPVWTISYDGRLQQMFDMTDIQELQLLIPRKYHSEEHLEFITDIFDCNLISLLERLFVHLPGHVTDASDADAAAALAGEVVDDSEPEIDQEAYVLESLRFIKLVNFRGTRFELKLLAFILKRDFVLENLVLVTVGEEGDEHLEDIQRHVSAMLKASPSPDARLTVCRPSQDSSQNPAHTKLYDELLYDDDE